MMRYALLLSLASACALAMPTQLEERQGTVVGIIISSLVGLIKEADKKWDPCNGWQNGIGGSKAYWSERQSGTADATLCYTNSTSANGKSYKATIFAQRDADVAKCLSTLHRDQGDICISTKGSPCDINDYLATGGMIVNSRIPGIGKGVSDKWKVTADQNQAIHDLYQNLVGQNLQRRACNADTFLWNLNGDKHEFINTPGGYCLDLLGGEDPAPSC